MTPDRPAERHTLVLNAGYEPLCVVPWQRAVSLWARERVEIIEVYEDVTLRSGSRRWELPAVVRLTSHVPWRDPGPPLTRRLILVRDGNRCQYCGRLGEARELTLDHVIPRRQGGQSRWENLVVACLRCNHEKGARTPAQAGLRLLSQPRRPNWPPGSPQREGLIGHRAPAQWAPYLRGGRVG